MGVECALENVFHSPFGSWWRNISAKTTSLLFKYYLGNFVDFSWNRHLDCNQKDFFVRRSSYQKKLQGTHPSVLLLLFTLSPTCALLSQRKVVFVSSALLQAISLKELKETFITPAPALSARTTLPLPPKLPHFSEKSSSKTVSST